MNIRIYNLHKGDDDDDDDNSNNNNNKNNEVQILFSWDIVTINVSHSIAATLCTLEK